ncbi:unnamed protein product [marine sediment metagenome]|uniref:Uncharacterized protein n=1 Tax=marine sediment metagenome TaxID=412755 RepID=X1CNI4_9ZZZZ
MIVKIEIECPYCDKIHVHSLDIGIPEIKEKKKSDTKVEDPDVV